MTTPGDASAASEGLGEAEATAAFANLLAQEGDSEGDETQGEEESSARAASDDEEVEAFSEDDEEQSDEGDEPDEDEEQPEVFTVKVDGKELQVPLPELLKGYSREQDYSRKTMALGEERKALETEKAAVSEARANYVAVLDIWAKQVEQAETAETPEELEALRRSDPGEYAARIAERQQRKEHRDNIIAERARVLKQEQEEQVVASRARLAEEGKKLFEAIPSWADPEKGEARAKADKKVMAEYAGRVGLTPDEINGIADHRYMVILRDAAAYRALQSKKPEVRRQVEAVKTARPGNTSTRPNKVTEVERAKTRLKATGSDQDAQAAFMKIL